MVFQATAAPLRRLTGAEYRNSVQDLFAGVELPAVEVPADARQDGYTTVAAGQAPSALSVEQYQRSAQTLANVAMAERGTWAPCTADSDACAKETLESLAERAYRRPLQAVEREQIATLVAAANAWGGPAAALVAGLEAILQSPTFLYRPEFGAAQPIGAAVALTDYEVASRLSYFLTATLPDATLLQAAERGDLSTDSGLRAQAERLLADPRARPVMNDFFAQWLRLERLDSLALDPALFPEFDQQLRADLKQSVLRFVDYALWEVDSFDFLMSGEMGFVNDRLAPIYGVASPGGEALTLIGLDSTQRRGLLTQPGVLTASSHGTRHSPILRGVTMLDSILCSPVPAPPPGIFDMNEDADVDSSQICTTRDDVTLSHTSGATCQGCHKAIDGAGFAFEHYDALGRYRKEENGCPIDATASFAAADLAGDLADAVTLAPLLSQSRTVQQCFGQQLFRFALGRKESTNDRCQIAAVAEELQAGDDSLQRLVVKLVLSPSFRSRPAS